MEGEGATRDARRKWGGDDGAERAEAAGRGWVVCEAVRRRRVAGAPRAPSFGEKAASAMDAAACVFRVSLRNTAVFAEMQFS